MNSFLYRKRKSQIFTAKTTTSLASTWPGIRRQKKRVSFRLWCVCVRSWECKQNLCNAGPPVHTRPRERALVNPTGTRTMTQRSVMSEAPTTRNQRRPSQISEEWHDAQVITSPGVTHTHTHTHTQV